MKNKANKSVGKIGTAKVSIIVHQANCIFHKIELENDIGNDAFIEFISGEESTSFCIAAQIKAGESIVRQNGIETFIPTDKEHLEYWYNLNLPVAGFTYNPNNDTVYWIDIKEYITNNPNVIEEGPYNLPVPVENVFSYETFNLFYDHFIEYGNTMKDLEYFMTSVDNISEMDDVESQYIGIKSLFTYHRNKYASWFILLNYFKCCKDDYLRRNLIYVISHIAGGHGDIFWHKGNIINQDIVTKVKKLINQIWGESEFKLLLESINEEEGIQRGSIGQSIYSIIDLFKNRDTLLLKAAFDEEIPDHSKYCALLMYLYDFQFDHDTGDSINLINEYLSKFPNCSCYEHFQGLRSCLEECGQFDIY